ncbi:CRTAC1 family protein [Pelagibius litoralis]|uniref:CRTAC1 family protein n=1 Tax=Pelagibius litoralis TaxID=374515 RepID=A0A967C6I5_9PROT|nr:CRTAC1 family protein [Pelagibius litoralis]NIA67482.1 CRTAC1 family protein [Pelagibius litoralis]
MMRTAAGLLVLGLLLQACSPATETSFDRAGLTVPLPSFAEETRASGLTHVFSGERRYVVGGGLAHLDCDDDGMTDLYLAGGASTSGLFRNRGVAGGALKFEAEAGSPLAMDAVTGAYALDIDGDGLQDLAVLRFGENVLFRGLGDCRFERANETWGFDGGAAWSTAFAAIWEEGEAWPTLAIGNYIDLDQPGAPWGTCFDNRLHRPGPGGGFAAPLALSPGYCALSMLFTDWNGDGQADLRISNDRQYYRGGEEQLWHVRPGAAPRPYTRAEGWAQLQVWGMGIASHDVTGDGLPDYFLTSMADNKLRTLDGGGERPAYRDIAFTRGVTAHRPYEGDQSKPSTAWHAEFQDVNNDTLADLFVAKGNIEAMEDFALRDPNNLLLGLPDGSFAEAGGLSGLDSGARGRGAAVVDLNADGLLDVVVLNRKEPAQVWRGLGIDRPGDSGSWLRVRLRQASGNRDAVGAWVELRTAGRIQRREVFVGGGHAGGGTGWLHFGLGNQDSAEIRVRWPQGDWGPWLAVAGGEFVELFRDDDVGDRLTTSGKPGR